MDPETVFGEWLLVTLTAVSGAPMPPGFWARYVSTAAGFLVFNWIDNFSLSKLERSIYDISPSEWLIWKLFDAQRRHGKQSYSH